MSRQSKAKRICVPVTEMHYWPDYTYESDATINLETTICSCGLTSGLCSHIRAEEEKNAINSSLHYYRSTRIVPHVFMILDRVR